MVLTNVIVKKNCPTVLNRLITHWFLFSDQKSGKNLQLFLTLIFHATKGELKIILFILIYLLILFTRSLSTCLSAASENIFPETSKNSNFCRVLSKLLGDDQEKEWSGEDLATVIEAIRKLPLHRRVRFIMRLNNYFALESMRMAEIKYWSCYFVLVDYLG